MRRVNWDSRTITESEAGEAQKSPSRSITSSRLILAGLLVLFAFSESIRLDFLFAQEPPPPVLTTILVTPDPALLDVGSRQQFSVQGLDQFGNPIETNPVWAATGGAIDDTGLYTTKTTSGRFTVTAMDGTIRGHAAVTINDSAPGQVYLNFDGIDDYVDIRDTDALDLTDGEFTISAWINPSDWGQNGQGRIIDHGGGSSGSAGWTVQVEEEVRGLRLQINTDSSFNDLSNRDVIALNTWQQVAVTLKEGMLTYYVDGVESGVRTGVPTPHQIGSPVRIGRRATDTERAFAGGIDEIRIWDRALTPAEIREWRSARLTGSEAGLVAYYRLNEGKGLRAIDNTARQNHGVFGATADAENPTWVNNVTFRPTVRILPLGDSITQGSSERRSYRYPLWTRLIDAGISFDLVGSQHSNRQGNPVWPDYNGLSFDRDHEGHSGRRADQILDGLPDWLKGYTPDIVLLHIGTNDVYDGQSTQSIVDEIEEIIDLLRADNPRVTVLLARLIPVASPHENEGIIDLNKHMDSIAASKATPESPVVVVDQNSGFDAEQDTYDGIHPNPVGEEKIAQEWTRAVISVLPQLATSGGTAN
jgi:lysophospholipase L1-like esterase